MIRCFFCKRDCAGAVMERRGGTERWWEPKTMIGVCGVELHMWVCGMVWCGVVLYVCMCVIVCIMVRVAGGLSALTPAVVSGETRPARASSAPRAGKSRGGRRRV